MLAVRAGEMPALRELYLRYYDRARFYFYRMQGRDEELARDLAQDLFVKLAQKAHYFEPSRSFSTWFFSIAHNMCKNRYRHREVKEKVHEEIKGNQPLWVEAEVNTLQLMQNVQFQEALEQVLSRLSPEKKTAFILRYRENWGVKEIAEVLELPEGTVKSRLFYTLKDIAKALKAFNPQKI